MQESFAKKNHSSKTVWISSSKRNKWPTDQLHSVLEKYQLKQWLNSISHLLNEPPSIGEGMIRNWAILICCKGEYKGVQSLGEKFDNMNQIYNAHSRFHLQLYPQTNGHNMNKGSL